MNPERLWFLRRWEWGGWQDNILAAKKWEQHLKMLVRDGLLEVIPEGYPMYRITPAGRAALSAAKAEGAR